MELTDTDHCPSDLTVKPLKPVLDTQKSESQDSTDNADISDPENADMDSDSEVTDDADEDGETYNDDNDLNSDNDMNEEDNDEEEVADNDMDDADKQLYCVCRSTDSKRFMIACDGCTEWFHGDCMKIRKKDARKIAEWFCPPCLDSNPSLRIRFKKKVLDSSPEKSENMEQADTHKHKERKRKDSESRAKRSTRRCGHCKACLNQTDCSVCDFCKDMRKFGGPGKLRQKCRQRQCFYLSKVSKRTIYFKYSSSSESKPDSSQLDVLLSTAKQHLPGDHKKKLDELIRSEHMYTHKREDDEERPESPPPPFDHSYSMSFPPPADPAPSDSLTSARETQDSDGDMSDSDTKSKKNTKKRKQFKYEDEKDSDWLDEEDAKALKEAMKKQRQKQKLEKENLKRKGTQSRREATNKQRRLNTLTGTNRVTRSTRPESPKQCLGPGCVNAARDGSKYCSHDCGVQLQIRRLQVIIPHRLKEMKSLHYVANDKAEEKLKEMKVLQKQCKDKLLELDEEHKVLEDIVAKAQGLSVCQEEVNEEALDSDLDLTTYCVSCGLALGPRIAFKHMEKCWAKLECLMSFGALMRSAGNLFCDTFMNQQGTYCKRLRIMCPEHYKEKKYGPDSVCGCPLVDDRLKATENLCRNARNKCTRHVAWERLWRADIDLKRVHQWWKLEDSLEQERQIRIEMGNRNNVLGVLFNSTKDHSVDESGDDQGEVADDVTTCEPLENESTESPSQSTNVARLSRETSPVVKKEELEDDELGACETLSKPGVDKALEVKIEEENSVETSLAEHVVDTNDIRTTSFSSELGLISSQPESNLPPNVSVDNGVDTAIDGLTSAVGQQDCLPVNSVVGDTDLCRAPLPNAESRKVSSDAIMASVFSKVWPKKGSDNAIKSTMDNSKPENA